MNSTSSYFRIRWINRWKRGKTIWDFTVCNCIWGIKRSRRICTFLNYSDIVRSSSIKFSQRLIWVFPLQLLQMSFSCERFMHWDCSIKHQRSSRTMIKSLQRLLKICLQLFSWEKVFVVKELIVQTCFAWMSQWWHQYSWSDNWSLWESHWSGYIGACKLWCLLFIHIYQFQRRTLFENFNMTHSCFLSCDRPEIAWCFS